MSGLAPMTTDARGAAEVAANAASTRNAQAFRAILDALSRPGAPVTLAPTLTAEAPAPLSPACAMVLTTLVDADARVWLAPSRRTEEIERLLRFQTSAAPAASPRGAAFLCGRWDELVDAEPDLGTPTYPDRSATLLIEVDDLAQFERQNAPDGAARLSGPGLAAPTALLVEGVGPDFWRYAQENAGRYPCGVDFIFCAGRRLVGLPRSTRVQHGQGTL